MVLGRVSESLQKKEVNAELMSLRFLSGHRLTPRQADACRKRDRQTQTDRQKTRIPSAHREIRGFCISGIYADDHSQAVKGF